MDTHHPCLAQCCHFTVFVVSADGLLGHEADVMVCQLAGKYAKKTEKPYSVLCGSIIKLALPFFVPFIAVLEAPVFPLASGCMSSHQFLNGCISSSMAGWCRPGTVPSVNPPPFLFCPSFCLCSSFFPLLATFLPSSSACFVPSPLPCSCSIVYPCLPSGQGSSS